MPKLSRWLIRAALANLVIGFGIAAVLLSRKGLPAHVSPQYWQWLPAHYDLLLVGFMVQLSMGVSYWILPRMKGTDRGRPLPALAGSLLLPIGVWVFCGAVLAMPLIEWQAGWQTLQVVGLVMQVAGFLSFAGHLWPRIRPMIVPT